MLTWYEIVAVGCILSGTLILVVMTLVSGYLEKKIVKRLKERGIIE